MLSKVNIAILRPFLFFLCLSKLIIRLNLEVIFILLLYRILHSLNHIQLPLLMLGKVNIAIIIKTISILSLSNKANNTLKSRDYLQI